MILVYPGGLQCIHTCPQERQREIYHIQKRKHVTTETGTEVMWPQAKECPQPPEAERGKKWVSSQSIRMSVALLTL